MRQVKEFIDALVKTSYQEKDGEYGFFPFHMVSGGNDDKINIAAMMLGASEDYYRMAKNVLDDGSEWLHLAMDFPKMGDIGSDFIMVFSVEGNEIDALAIPYDTKTGVMDNKFLYVNDSRMVYLIKNQFIHYLSH